MQLVHLFCVWNTIEKTYFVFGIFRLGQMKAYLLKVFHIQILKVFCI